MTRVNELGFCLRVAGALALAALALSACGKTAGPGSGETHFLQSCDSICGGGYECLCGVCTRPCDDDLACSSEASAASCQAVDGCGASASVCDVGCSSAADCAELGGDFRCDAGVCRQEPAALVCTPGCFPVSGHPQDSERQCADLTRAAQVACQCGEPAANSSCFTRASDQTNWMLPDGEFEDPTAWAYCGPNVWETLSSSCDFVSCEHRPSSFCTPEDTCTGHECGSFQSFDDGCAKAACEDDGDCPSDERCVALESIDTSQCSYSADGICNCGGPAIDLSGAFCNPTSETGPRGEWQTLNVIEDNGECVPDACRYEWHVTADGSVALFKAGVDSSAQLSAEDLEALVALIDGPELRRDLGNANPSCMVEDHDIVFELELPEETQVQIVTGCLEGNVYERVWEILQKY